MYRHSCHHACCGTCAYKINGQEGLGCVTNMLELGTAEVVVEPMERSTQAYHPFDPITTNGSINVYLGPGNNYAILPESINGAGTISDPLNKLWGVFAKGAYWWKVKVGSTEGWVSELDIARALKNQTSTELKPR